MNRQELIAKVQALAEAHVTDVSPTDGAYVARKSWAAFAQAVVDAILPPEPIYAVRIEVNGDTHPHYLGPLTPTELDETTALLLKAGASYEASVLLAVEDLPGIFQL